MGTLATTSLDLNYEQAMDLTSPNSARDSAKPVFPPSIRTRRATVACTRCRRHRSKCKHNGAIPPCAGCREAGSAVAETCRFVGRAGKEITSTHISSPLDHEIRSAAVEPGSRSIPSQGSVRADYPLNELPPSTEIIEGCNVFIHCCFQLTFISKLRFLAQVEEDPSSVDQFLLICILSVSARFTPSLIKRFGGPVVAAEVFVQKAERMATTTMYKPTVENAQGFIILSLAQWAKGDCNKSLIHLGISATIVGMLRLYREDTYLLSEDAPPEEFIYCEAARRTLWMMGMLRNLFAGLHSPMPFALQDLSALLPCEENEFAFGIVPKARAALPTSQAALDHPELVNCTSRSLFGTMIQAYKFWGQVARGACLNARKSNNGNVSPWDNSSQYSQLSMALLEFEDSLSKEHQFSEWNLRVYRADNLDIAYSSIFLAIRLGNIVLRRTYLNEMKVAILSRESSSPFLEGMSRELFTNFSSLYEGIMVYLSQRSITEGFPPLLPFSVYLCGSLATHLLKCPQMCPRLAHRAMDILRWSKIQLSQVSGVWPVARHWHQALETASAELPSLSADSLGEYQQFNPDLASLSVMLDTNEGTRMQQMLMGTEHSSSADPLGLLYDYPETMLVEMEQGLS